MPDWVVERVADLQNERGRSVRGSAILMVGVSYKKDVPDLRESPALKVLEKLLCKGANVSYHDPFVPVLPRHYGAIPSVPLTRENVAAADCVLLLTDHSSLDRELLAEHACLLLDTRNGMKGYRGAHVVCL
jgi:UDP-N-acetyl-D-glucosamine dehydrogenase